MSMIYNKVYRVPAWLVISGNKSVSKVVITAFKELGAHEVKWLASTFPATVSVLATQGWRHEVNKPMPFFVNPDFLNYALSQHIKGFGFNKSLTGQSANAMSAINRQVTSVNDYVRIFNDLIINESDIALSHLLSIGELCHGEHDKIKVFVSADGVPKNILQRLADRVITIGGAGSDVQLPATLKHDDIDDVVGQVAALLGYKK